MCRAIPRIADGSVLLQRSLLLKAFWINVQKPWNARWITGLQLGCRRLALYSVLGIVHAGIVAGFQDLPENHSQSGQNRHGYKTAGNTGNGSACENAKDHQKRVDLHSCA